MSITGFYYMALDRQNGNLVGWYFDRDCFPFQKATLQPVQPGNGCSIPAFEFR